MEQFEVDDNLYNDDLIIQKYFDEHIVITNKYLEIKNYYYPFNKSKIIPLNEIKRIELVKLNLATGKYKYYGIGYKLWWFHFDKKRPLKDYCIVIYNNSTIKPAITPAYPEEAYNILLNLIKK